MTGVNQPERLQGPLAAVFRVALVALEAIDIDAGDVHIRAPVQNPVRHHPTQSATGNDADGVQAGRHEIVPEFRRLANDRCEVGRKTFRAAEKLANARLH